MATKTQIPRKHVGKKTTAAQDKEIEALQDKMSENLKRPVSWLEAKHEYFEKQEANDIVASAIATTRKEVAAHKKRKSGLTIAETKLGVTMVLSLEDCKALGFKGNEMTGYAIENVRRKLGLKTRAEMRTAA